MKVDATCPHCEVTLLVESEDDKNTIVCNNCYRPYEFYPDGRTEISALYETVGYNWYSEPNVFCDPGLPSFRTRENEK
jgi:hypothetical protein